MLKNSTGLITTFDCMIGEEIKEGGYPYKSVTTFDNDSYLCFLVSEDTVSYLKTTLLKLIDGDVYSSSNDYNTKIVYIGTFVGHNIFITNRFKTKTNNNILFIMRKPLKDDTNIPFKNIAEGSNTKIIINSNILAELVKEQDIKSITKKISYQHSRMY